MSENQANKTQTKIEELFSKIVNKAKEFGLQPKNDGRDIKELKGNAIIRKNLGEAAFSDGTAYFGFIGKEEETAGVYSDFSLVIFPEKERGYCVVALGVGSLGFKNDYNLATLPGLRRQFLKLRLDDDTTFFKTSFDDIESTSSDLLKRIKASFSELTQVIDRYKTVLPASQIVDFSPSEENALSILYRWVALYAKVRGWPTNKAQRDALEKEIKNIPAQKVVNSEQEIKNLLQRRHYVILQGAPGTGKTYTALKIAEEYDNENVFFEQFHAETTYSDFIYGIQPNLRGAKDEPQFEPKEGILYKAIKKAMESSDKRILLIIDEINRANLSNILGPVFYLFENQANTRRTKLCIGNLAVEKLPENLDVLATMNTADRSLAVVDFALRRRFAWYTLKPYEIKPDNGKKFYSDIFKKFADIFFEYATDDELNLQPGQSYFIATDDNEMNERLIYELLPLIKEYLVEGYLTKAKNSFTTLFLEETGKLMYE